MWSSKILEHALTEWGISIGIAVGAWLFGRLLYWLFTDVLKDMARRTEGRVDDVLLGALGQPVVVLVTMLGFQIAFERLEFVGRVAYYGGHAFKAAWALVLTWTIVRAVSALLHEYLLPYAKQRGATSMDESVMALTVRAVGILIWGMGIIGALNNAGYNVSALLAGVGISGLALAMAAKDTVANVFGGITVFADQPFRTGDRIRVAGHDGTVLRVGMRSTRIRTLDGPVVVVPNFKFTDSVLENVSEEASRRVRHELGLIYETSPERMERALQVLHEIVDAHQQELLPDRSAFFSGFKDFSLSVVFIYYIRKGRSIEDAQTMVHLEVLRRFASEGIEFAYPTQVEIHKEPSA
ncbi:MAG: mechanosensitive ion channel family protein [Flavobacteriales bacterium]|nr:mechanosensitive ion channel family protein [Flavobacteriales bacterium]